MSPKVLAACALLFLAPVGYVVLSNPEILGESFKADPSRGHLLYFTLPG